MTIGGISRGASANLTANKPVSLEVGLIPVPPDDPEVMPILPDSSEIKKLRELIDSAPDENAKCTLINNLITKRLPYRASLLGLVKNLFNLNATESEIVFGELARGALDRNSYELRFLERESRNKGCPPTTFTIMVPEAAPPKTASDTPEAPTSEKRAVSSTAQTANLAAHSKRIPEPEPSPNTEPNKQPVPKIQPTNPEQVPQISPRLPWEEEIPFRKAAFTQDNLLFAKPLAPYPSAIGTATPSPSSRPVNISQKNNPEPASPSDLKPDPFEGKGWNIGDLWPTGYGPHGDYPWAGPQQPKSQPLEPSSPGKDKSTPIDGTTDIK